MREHRGVEYRHGKVPRNQNFGNAQQGGKDRGPVTTLMIRNIPNRYTQKDLIQEVDALGFAGTYDFFYLPIDKSTESNVGYAFLNFKDSPNCCYHNSL